MQENGNKRQAETSRRKFMERLGSTALVTAGAILPNLGCRTQTATPKWSATVDWICVGSGCAGCAAAIAGHDKGLRTLLLEKEAMIGGDTALSGGILWVPMNFLQKPAGVNDSREDGLNYLRFVGSGYAIPEYMEALVDNAARVIDYLHQKADVNFRMLGKQFYGGGDFYYPIAPGSKDRGRLLVPEAFAAENLGAWRNKVQLPVYVRGLLEAMEGKGESGDTERFGPVRTDPAKLALWRKRLGDAKVDAILKEDEARRIGGAALVSYLFRAVIKRGIEVRTETGVEKLIEENGRIQGVQVDQRGKKEFIKANKGILLAMGGPENGLGGHGPSWMLPAIVGGETYSTSRVQQFTSVSAPGDNFPNGAPLGRPNTEVEMKHSMVVNRFGERFGDESFFQAFGSKLHDFDIMGEHRFRNVPAYLIFDQNLIETYSFAGMPPGNTEFLDWVTQGKTLAEVADKLKLPAAKLEASVARFNENVRRGKDIDYNRKPPTMGPIGKPPFYGVHLTTSDPMRADTKVVISPRAEVLHYATGKPIPGLYACGAVTATIRIWGTGFQAGYSLISGITFGFLAAEHAAAPNA